MSSPLDADSLERLVPEKMHPEDTAAHETYALHVERYRFAATHAIGPRVLDLACGVGYGTRLLADENEQIESGLGVDVSAAAVEYASGHYADERVSYRCENGMAFSDDAGFDTVVSLETVEHVPDPDAFFARLVSLVRPGGRLISSVPITPSVDLNPHHLSDFTARSFRAMGERHGLVELQAFTQTQRIGLVDVFKGDRFKRDNLRPNLVGYYLSHPTAAWTRTWTTLRHGFANLYLTLAWRRGD